MEERQKYRIKLLELKPTPGWPEVIPEAYYGDVPGVGMNRAIYCRTPIEKAFLFTREQALQAILGDLRGYPARCEPPITVTY